MSDNEEKEVKTLDEVFKFNESTAKYIKEHAQKEGMSPEQFVEDVMTGNPFAIFEFEETSGKVKMMVWNPDPSENIAGRPKDGPTRLKAYRDLRDNFPPISAGINYHKRFMLGGGFTVAIDDPLDHINWRCRPS